MIPLTNRSSTTTQKLQAFLGGAAATTNPTVTVSSYIVPPQSKTVSGTNGSIAGDPSEYRCAPQFTVLAGATETDIADAPPEGSVKDINFISIYNTDTASVTVTVCVDDNGTNRLLIKATLGTLESLYYEDGRGWYSTDANGAIKTTSSAYTPSVSAFFAYNSADDTNQTGNGATVTVDFDTEVFDVLGEFSADTFTALSTGKYAFQTSVRMSAIPAGCTSCLFTIVSSNTSVAFLNEVFVAATWSAKHASAAATLDLDAGDTAIVRVQFSGGAGNTATVEGQGSPFTTWFSGSKVAA